MTLSGKPAEKRIIRLAKGVAGNCFRRVVRNRVVLSKRRAGPPGDEVFAYVGASRPEYDLQVFADDAGQLLRVLSRENEQTKALAPEQIEVYRERLIGLVKEPKTEIEREQAIDYGIAL